MIIQLGVVPFSIVYLLLLIVLAVMSKCRIDQSRILFIASMRMTVQLILAGLVLTYIFENPHPLFTLAYIAAMLCFAAHRVLSLNKHLSKRFKWIVLGSLASSSLSLIVFLIGAVVRTDIFNPQYTIPLGGMVIGNAMTGLNLGLKTFHEQLGLQTNRMETLLNLGVEPRRILYPIANKALETAVLPTINSMIGMGVVALPGMMTGQILSGTLPMTAILYQIAIMITVCCVTCLSVFGALYGGCRTMWNSRQQLLI